MALWRGLSENLKIYVYWHTVTLRALVGVNKELLVPVTYGLWKGVCMWGVWGWGWGLQVGTAMGLLACSKHQGTICEGICPQWVNPGAFCGRPGCSVLSAQCSVFSAYCSVLTAH